MNATENFSCIHFKTEWCPCSHPVYEENTTTSFPGSLFSASIVVEITTMEAEKRDPGNEVENTTENEGGPQTTQV